MITPTPRYFRKVNRKILRNTYENKSNKLKFGQIGIQVLEKGFLTVRQIEAVRRTITGRLKRKAKIWIRAYPDYPKTAKPQEVRMGRGKGNVSSWVCFVKPGKIIFEAFSKEPERLKDALHFALRKLPFFAQIVSRDVYY